jgi:hypothetical protein
MNDDWNLANISVTYNCMDGTRILDNAYDMFNMKSYFKWQIWFKYVNMKRKLDHSFFFFKEIHGKH